MKLFVKVLGVVVIGGMAVNAGLGLGDNNSIDMSTKLDKNTPQMEIVVEKSFDEKATEALVDWKDKPVGTESPFHNEDGSNPVYDGMQDEALEQPQDSNSPFFVPGTGENVVEKNLQKELEERRTSPETSTFENPFER